MDSHTILQPAGVPRGGGKRGRHSRGETHPETKDSRRAVKQAVIYWDNDTSATENTTAPRHPDGKPAMPPSIGHAGDPGEVTARGESGGMLVVPGTGFPPVSPPTRHTDTNQKPAETRQGCYTPREGAKGNRFRTGSMGAAATPGATACDSLRRHLDPRSCRRPDPAGKPVLGTARQGSTSPGLSGELHASAESGVGGLGVRAPSSLCGARGGDGERPHACRGPRRQV